MVHLCIIGKAFRALSKLIAIHNPNATSVFFKVFPVPACIFSCRLKSWLCQVGHHFSAINKAKETITRRCFRASKDSQYQFNALMLHQ